MKFLNVLKADPFNPPKPHWALILKKFNPNQPRDADGKFARSGATGAHSPVKHVVAANLLAEYSQNSTLNEILSKFDNNTRAHLTDAEDRLKEDIQRGLETDKLYKGEDGQYNKERQAIHKDIIKKFLNGEMLEEGLGKGEFETKAKPKVIFLGGRGGSGKSSFSMHNSKDVGVYDPKKTLVVDPDAIKAALGKHPPPNYEGYNAFLFHEESGHVADLLVKAARRKKLDMVMDITLKSDKTAEVKKFQKAGYTADAHYMFLPPQLAAQRAIGRFMTKAQDGSGRLVPPEVILGNTKNEQNFDKLIPLVDNWSVYRNDVKQGEPPKLVDRRRK